MIKYWILLFLSVFISSLSQLLLKLGARKKYDSVLREYLNVYVIAGYAMLFGATLLTVLAFKGLDFKNGPVTEALGFVLVMLFCRVFLKEKITPRKLIGNALIVLGVVIFYL